jgi:hypothetical protein
MPITLATWGVRDQVQGKPRQKVRPYLKNTKKTDGVAGLVECLPSKCEALSSNLSIIPPKKENSLMGGFTLPEMLQVLQQLFYFTGDCGLWYPKSITPASFVSEDTKGKSSLNGYPEVQFVQERQFLKNFCKVLELQIGSLASSKGNPKKFLFCHYEIYSHIK